MEASPLARLGELGHDRRRLYRNKRVKAAPPGSRGEEARPPGYRGGPGLTVPHGSLLGDAPLAEPLTDPAVRVFFFSRWLQKHKDFHTGGREATWRHEGSLQRSTTDISVQGNYTFCFTHKDKSVCFLSTHV